MALSPEILTARLLLRPPRGEDFKAWAAFAADPEATYFLGGPQPVATSWRGMSMMAGTWSLYGFGMFSVLERDTGRWIGRVGPWQPPDWPGQEIGWALSREVWGQGLASEAVCAATDWALQTLGWDAFIHCIDAANTRSRALARRLGSRWLRRAVLPAPFGVEVEVYGQSALDWRAGAAQRRGGLPR